MSNLSELESAMHTWEVSQGPMTTTMRWGNFPTYGQNLGQHVNSLPSVVMFVKSKLTRTSNIDWALIYECVHLHDHGEPLTRGDEHAGNKTHDKDIREYEAFCSLVAEDSQSLQEAKMSAFLLQYIRKSAVRNLLHPADQRRVGSLATTHYREALIFELVERLDYIFSAVKAHRLGIRNEMETMFSHVMHNQVLKLNGLTEEWPALVRVWTPALQSELLDLAFENVT